VVREILRTLSTSSMVSSFRGFGEQSLSIDGATHSYPLLDYLAIPAHQGSEPYRPGHLPGVNQTADMTG
jgi:hypothetical protein